MTEEKTPPTEDQPEPSTNGAATPELGTTPGDVLKEACQQAINVFAGALSESIMREGGKFNPLDMTIQQRIGFIHFDALLAALLSTMAETSPEASKEFDERLTRAFIHKLMTEADELKKPKIAISVGAALQQSLKGKRGG